MRKPIAAIIAFGAALLPPLAQAEVTYVVCSSAELRSRGLDTQITIGIDYASGRAGAAGVLNPATISETEIDWQQGDSATLGKYSLNRVSGDMWVASYIGGQHETTIIWQCRRAQAQF